MSTQCYLNGEFLPVSQARVSVLDRGFLFGDGVYEVIPIYDRRPLGWQAHRQRLSNSLKAIHLPFDVATLTDPMRCLVEAHESDNQAVYLQITRGANSRRQHKPDTSASPTVFMMTQYRPPVAKEKLTVGVSCTCQEDFRWRRGHIKSTSLLAAVLLAIECGDNEEVILLRDGLVSEGYSSNYIIVHGHTIITPISDERILRGVSADIVLSVCKQAGHDVHRQDISQSALMRADEVWVTSSLRELIPVTTIDNRPVGSGRVGEVFRSVYGSLQTYIKKEAAWT